MKKYILFITSLAVMACTEQKAQDPHQGHDHAGETHSHQEEGEGHDHDHQREEKTVAAEITFTPQTAALGSFAVEKAKKGTFFSIIKTAGRSISSPVGESVVVAPSDGIVLYNSNISEGVNVNAGDNIMSVSSKKMADGDSYTQVLADYNLAKNQWDRAQKLISDRIISENEYQTAKADFLKKKSIYDAISTDKSGNVAVKTPFAGYIKNIKAAHGSYLRKGDALFSIVKNNRARLEVDVPQKYFSRMGDVVSAVFTSDEGKTYDTALLNGKIVSYSKSVSSAGRLSMTIEYDGVADIPEGAFVKVSLRIGSEDDVVTIPMSAITEEQGEYFVYVQLDDECYQKRPVTLGGNDDIRAVVLSGITQDDTVVSRGAYRVKLAGNTGAIPHSHEH